MSKQDKLLWHFSTTAAKIKVQIKSLHSHYIICILYTIIIYLLWDIILLKDINHMAEESRFGLKYSGTKSINLLKTTRCETAPKVTTAIYCKNSHMFLKDFFQNRKNKKVNHRVVWWEVDYFPITAGPKVFFSCFIPTTICPWLQLNQR